MKATLPTVGKSLTPIFCGILIVISQFDVSTTLQSTSDKSLENSRYDWDVLVFSQQWSVTACLNSPGNIQIPQCNLLKTKEIWTINAIWPKRLNPIFCKSTYEPEKFEEIVDQLHLLWPNLYNTEGDNFMWEQEWYRHGTCAANIQHLDDELKYFSQGLRWHSEFSMKDVLEKSGIYPNSNNTLTAIYEALFKVLGKKPFIGCIRNDERNINYLSDIRICFDKSLQLIDCDGVNFFRMDLIRRRNMNNCKDFELIHYPRNFLLSEKNMSPKESSKTVCPNFFSCFMQLSSLFLSYMFS